MDYRQFGSSGLRVPVLSFGTGTFGAEAQAVMSRCAPLILVGGVGGLGLGTLAGDKTHRRIRGWGELKDAKGAGLTALGGCILGVLGRRLLATTDLRPSLVTGGTRSGKGRGHVMPTLLSWNSSVLVHEPDEEGAGHLDQQFLDDLHVASRGSHMVAKGPFELQQTILGISLGTLLQATGDGPTRRLTERYLAATRLPIETGYDLGIGQINLNAGACRFFPSR